MFSTSFLMPRLSEISRSLVIWPNHLKCQPMSQWQGKPVNVIFAGTCHLQIGGEPDYHLTYIVHMNIIVLTMLIQNTSTISSMDLRQKSGRLLDRVEYR